MIWYLNWIKWLIFLVSIGSCLTAFAHYCESILSNQDIIVRNQKIISDRMKKLEKCWK